MWSTSAGGHLMKVVNLTGFTVFRENPFQADNLRSLQHLFVLAYIEIYVFSGNPFQAGPQPTVKLPSNTTI